MHCLQMYAPKFHVHINCVLYQTVFRLAQGKETQCNHDNTSVSIGLLLNECLNIMKLQILISSLSGKAIIRYSCSFYYHCKKSQLANTGAKMRKSSPKVFVAPHTFDVFIKPSSKREQHNNKLFIHNYHIASADYILFLK